MKTEPLKGKRTHQRFMPESWGEDGGFKESDIRSAIEWLKKELDADIIVSRRKSIIKLIDEAFEDVVTKET